MFNIYSKQRIFKRTKVLLLTALCISFWVLPGLVKAQNNEVKQAAVAMPDKHSALVAKQVLQQGGNAVDA